MGKERTTMKATITDTDALGAVAPNAIHAYLRARGWRHVEAYGDKGDVYGLDDAPEIVAPASSDFGDYAFRVSEIVDILGRVEDRAQLQILRDLGAATADLIRVRAPEAEEDGSISIGEGVTFIEQSRDLLMAAACAAKHPRATFRAGSVREAADYLSGVRLGQTERGSFVVTLLSPVPPSLGTADLFDCEDPRHAFAHAPFERRVAHTLVDSLSAIKEAIALTNRGGNIEVFRERIGRGVSANLCRALSGLINAGEGVGISLNWALTRPALDGVTPPSQIFAPADGAVLGEAAILLASRDSRLNERLEGFVTRLRREEDNGPGRVTIKALIDGELRSVSMDLGPEGYDKIATAYDGRCTVLVEGELKSRGHRWTLVAPRDIEIVPTTEDDD